MPQMPTLLEMLKAGAHFGHQGSRWHPKMQPYIFGTRNGIHVIDLEKTLLEVEKTLNYVKTLAAQGKVILFVGTKRQARGPVEAAAKSCGMPFVTERWIGGLLTNFDECKRRLKKYNTLKAEVASGEIEKYTKKEQVALKKQLEKMDKYLHGLADLDKLPDALYIADLKVEKTAVTEANKIRVPVVAVCDTNVDPTKATYIIPANDDAVNAITMLVNLAAEAVNEGKLDYEKAKLVLKEKEAAVKPLEPAKKERRALMKEESV